MLTKNYFKLPLNLGALIKNDEYKKCNLENSISTHIHLINTTYFGECTFDESYGCSIWDVDFDNLSNVNKIKVTITDSLMKSLKKHEKRLSKTSIEVKIKQEELSSSKTGVIIKKKVTIKVKGRIIKTDESFFYEENFYIGPLSY